MLEPVYTMLIFLLKIIAFRDISLSFGILVCLLKPVLWEQVKKSHLFVIVGRRFSVGIILYKAF